MKKLAISTLFFALLSIADLSAQNDVYTHRQYLSGKGSNDMVLWDFQCTDGNNSGKWTKIGVPSCWELQGFGTYQYGMKLIVSDKEKMMKKVFQNYNIIKLLFLVPFLKIII